MKKCRIKITVTVLLLSILCSLISIIPVTAQEEAIEKFHCTATLDQEFTDNEIIIMVMPDYNFTPYTKDAFSEIGCVGVKELTRDVEESIVNRIILLTLSTHSKQNVLNAIASLELRDDIYSAEPNYIQQICETPNDEKYTSGKQWAIDKISLPDAWGETTGSSAVYVGVIDTGIDASHPDLQNRVNTELSRCFTSFFDTALEDDAGHGTKVAGIIGAEGNNAIGVTGTCWNVQLVSLRVASDSGGLVVSAAIDAIDYADSVGIKLLNYSAGGQEQHSLVESFKNAIQRYSGLFVCAAGNEYLDNDKTPHYPSEFNNLPNVISVGASTEEDTKRSSSNFGQTKVDLFAPGEDILTTVIGSRKYAKAGGTSYAAPYVTGVAALILSKYPTMNAAHIKYSILANVDIVYDSDGESVFGTLCKSGGRLNAYSALENAQTDHIFDYTSIGDEEHTAVCTICDYTGETDPHMFRYLNDGLSAGHTATCIGCGYSFSEFHTWITVGAKYRCSECGATSTQVPVLPFALSPEILAKIEQMGYIGDFAMDIGDGTVLCRIGDQYYLVRGQTVDTALQHLQYELSVILPDHEAA